MKRLLLVLLGLALVAPYFYVAQRTMRASRWALSSSAEGLRRAISLEPNNSDHYFRLARFEFFVNQDPKAAAGDYERSVAINPYVSSYWLGLAGARQVEGDLPGQQSALERALKLDPTSGEVAWQAANFFLVQGETVRALDYLRVVMENDPISTASALQLCWRATPDMSVIMQHGLPRQAPVYLALLDIASRARDVERASSIWDGTLQLHQSFDPTLAFSYIDLLAAEKQLDKLTQVHNQLLAMSPELRKRLSDGNLISNAGFEEKILNGGFDWRYYRAPNAALDLDSNEFHTGNRSLSITYNGDAGDDAGIFQLVPVEPNTPYSFSGYIKTEEILSASGPRLGVFETYSNPPQALFLTDDSIGSNPWRELHGQFTTGPETRLVAVRIARDPGNTHIRGKAWVDDLKLVKKQSQ